MITRAILGTGVAAALGLAACRLATGGDAEYWAPTPGAGGSDPAGSGGASTTSTSTGSAGQAAFSVQLETVSFGGEYAPDNVGAVWITDGQDQFVKTLGLWATKRIKYLYTWRAASGGNVVDAVTGATHSSHGPHQYGWDATDVAGNVVPDGPYRVYMEFTEHNAQGAFTLVDFDKGAAPVDLSAPDLPNFKGIRVVYTP